MSLTITLPYSLEELRLVAIAHERLPENFVKPLEIATKGRYHGHTLLDLGVVSIFLSNDPRSCTTRANKTLKIHKVLKDTTVSSALLDIDTDNMPLTLDIYPKLITRR